MAIYSTSQGRSVDHCHVGDGQIYECDCVEQDWSDAEKDEQSALLLADYPDLIQVRRPTCKYNCHGYAYARAHGWFCVPTYFIEDDFSVVPMDEAQEGDVLIYKQSPHGSVQHSARVDEAVDGEIRMCRSKWGKMGVVLHLPEYVPIEYYGHPWRLLRRLS